jgi:hypothetical protein
MDAAEAAANPAAGIAASAASGAAPDIVGDLASQVPGDVPATTMDAAEAAANPAGGLLNSGLGAPTGGDINLLSATSESANPANVVAPGTTGTDTTTAAASGTPTTATNPATAANPVPQPTGPATTAANGTAGLDPGQNLGQGQFAPGAEIAGVPSGSTAAGSDGGPLSGIMSFVEKHPTLAFGALQAGGSLLSGATSTLTPAQVSALQAQAAANNAAASLTKQQVANITAPKAVASSAPVTGTPALVPGQQGLINSASQPVTGRAA